MLEKIDRCDNNLEESSPTKTSKHTACGYSLFTHCSFNSSRSNFYRDADWMHDQVLCRFKTACNRNNQLWEKGNAAINREIESYNNQEFCHICKKKFYNVDDDSSDNSDDDSIMVVMMIAMMIAIMKNLLKSILVMLMDLMILMKMIMVIIAMMNLMLESFIVML